jgi:molybdopterin-guanine dinucleotide biosynthesis protein A
MDALILAGGENRRMHVLKGFLEINNRRIIESNIELLRGVFDRIVLSTNTPKLHFYLGVPMVGDIIGTRGPMTGIFSALMTPGVSEVFVTACDMPFINGILIQYMVERWEEKWDAAIPVFHGKTQPLFGIYSKKILARMEESLKNRKRSLRDFLRQIHVLYLSEEEVKTKDPEGKSFVNINTMEDFEREIGGRVCLV